jgi:site-specific DNA-methyltransferase (adenine-specific)
MEFAEKQVHLIPAKDINTEGRQREDYGNLVELSESIKTHGLIHPLTVTREDGKIVLCAGGRRFKALIMAGFLELPCFFREDLSELQRKEIELEENLQRLNISYQEQNDALMDIEKLKVGRLGKRGPKNPDGWSQEQTAELTGMSQPTVNRKIKLAKDFSKRPDLAEKVKHLPETAARKEFDRLLKQELTAAKIASGEMKVSSELKLGNAKRLFLEVPDASIDLILADPPFGMEGLEAERLQVETAKALGKSTKGKEEASQVYRMKLGKYDNLNPEQAVRLLEDIIPHFERVLKPGSFFYIFFENLLTISKVAQIIEDHENLVLMKPPIIWDKRRTTNSFTGYNYTACYEHIIWGQKYWGKHGVEERRRLKKNHRAIIEVSAAPIASRSHPFEKPVELLELLIENSSYPGDKVLDPFAGSGSTLLAAKKCKRTCIGFECNKDHYLTAQARMAESEAT